MLHQKNRWVITGNGTEKNKSKWAEENEFICDAVEENKNLLHRVWVTNDGECMFIFLKTPIRPLFATEVKL